MKNTGLKRLFALLLCGVLTAGSLPAAFGEETEAETQYTEPWELPEESVWTEPPETWPETEPVPVSEETGMSQDEKNAVIRRLSGLVFPMESVFYANIVDYAGCCGSGTADTLYGNINYSCPRGHSSYAPNDGLDLRAEYGAALFAPAAGTVYSSISRLVVEQGLGNGYSNYFILEGSGLAMAADGAYVDAGRQIGTAAGDIHYLAVTAPAGQGAAIAGDLYGCLSSLRSRWAVSYGDEGLLCINPSPSWEVQGNSVTAMLSGPGYTFPTAPVPETQPTEPETWPTEPETQPTEPETEPTAPAHTEHVWDMGYDQIPAAHMTTGIRVYTCTVCGQTREETIPNTPDHVFDQMIPSDAYLVRAATPTGAAVYFYSCACGQAGFETFEYGSPSECIDHVWDGGVYLKWPTHTEDGLIEYTCTICGQKRQETVPKTAEHTFDLQIVSDACLKEAASCYHPAIYYYVCVCGAVGTGTYEYGEKTGHTYSEAWSFNDIYHWHAAVCGHTTEVSCQAAHSWDAGVITVQPTATAAGVRTYSCMCGAKRTETVEPVRHQHIYSGMWSSDLYSHWHSPICGDTMEVKDYALHVWDGGVNVWEWQNGIQHQKRVYTCQVCQRTREETIHNFSQQVVSSAYLCSSATCTAPAVYYRSCVCGEKGTGTFTYGTANGHRYSGSWNSDIAYHWYTCTVCGTRGEIAQHCFDRQVVSPAYLCSSASCTGPAVYYLSCACGKKGSEIFTFGKTAGHRYSGVWNSGSYYHWQVCADCGSLGEIGQHRFIASSEKCLTCGGSSTALHVHSLHLTRVRRREASFLTPGNINYYTCTCGKWFADIAAVSEIVDHDAVVIPAKANFADFLNNMFSSMRGDTEPEPASGADDEALDALTDTARKLVKQAWEYVFRNP